MEKCPECGSDKIAYDEVTNQGQDAVERMSCAECNHEWKP